MSSNKTKCQNGIIKTSSRYAIDGEFCTSKHEYNVTVKEWWGKTKNFNPKEVTTEGGTCYRQTPQSGWRRYNKETKKYYNTSGTGTTIMFFENVAANPANNSSKVNLGSW
jgi:hypothetical protein